MKRNTFVKSCLALGSAALLPLSSVAASIKKYRTQKGFLVNAGGSRTEKPITLFEGDTFLTKVSTGDSDGDIYVYESSRAKEGGPAHHYHFSQDEWWYVLEGEFLIKIGDDTYHAKTGDSVFGPRMIPHSFAKIGEGNGRLLQFFQPAGKMEEFFTQISQGATKNMTEEEQDKFREAHGFKRVGPAIKNFKKM
ncbi:cupin domain-containing protein [Mucilaginibacter aquaedulcis]|uniref:cupin domain-containing protein n=1 Tax=Mucilaginibacter aquaedulcis TaxID=1187081 RepID=UPI0025B45CE9|nr:cupin domain-containing protein [Mucilaginibacter aquaedulcis]MDN3550239.1 cupin domain-containing protein [Mucilaginibacter aquaedulcis]